jgi:hypothetical protein
MYSYVCYCYAFVAIWNKFRYFFILGAYHPSTVQFFQHGCEKPWLFFEKPKAIREQTKFGKYQYRKLMQWYWIWATKLFGGKPVLAAICSPKILILLGLRLTKDLRGDRPGTNRWDHKETFLASSGFRWEFTDSSAKPGYGGRSFHRKVVTTLQST